MSATRGEAVRVLRWVPVKGNQASTISTFARGTVTVSPFSRRASSILAMAPVGSFTGCSGSDATVTISPNQAFV